MDNDHTTLATGLSLEQGRAMYHKFVMKGLQRDGYSEMRAEQLFDQYTAHNGELGASKDGDETSDAPASAKEVHQEEAREAEQQEEKLASQSKNADPFAERESQQQQMEDKELQDKVATEDEVKPLSQLSAEEMSEDDENEPADGDDTAVLRQKADNKLKRIKKLEKEKEKLVAEVEKELKPAANKTSIKDNGSKDGPPADGAKDKQEAKMFGKQGAAKKSGDRPPTADSDTQMEQAKVDSDAGEKSGHAVAGEKAVANALVDEVDAEAEKAPTA